MPDNKQHIPVSDRRPTWTHIPYVLIALALLAFLGYLVIYIIYASALFQFPFDYDQGEGFELMDTVLFSKGEWPYQDNNNYPFYSSNYPPFFHIAIVPLVWIFGPQYWTGRLVSFLGTLITAAAIGFAVNRKGGRPWLSALSGLAFLSSNYVYHVGPLFRQHMFMVMFETLAVVSVTIVIEREEQSGRRHFEGMLAVMLFLLLAGYTKQLAYASVAAVFFFLFLRGPKRAVVWAIPFGAVTVMLFFIIDLATQGQWLINTITANINPFVQDQALGLFRQWFDLHTILAISAALYAGYQLYFERLSAYSIWFIFAVLNSVSAGKWGAGESYFATAIAASCVLTGLLYNRMLNWSKLRGQLPYAGVLSLVGFLFLLQAGKVFHLPTHTPTLRAIATTLGKPTEVYIAPQTSCSAPREPVPVPYLDSAGATLLGRPPNQGDTAAGMSISNLILDGETAAFSEDAGFSFYVNRDVVTNPTQLLNLYNNDQVDLSEMLSMLEQQQFDTVILRAQFYPPPVLDVIGQRYHTTNLVEMNGFVYCILRPRGWAGDSSDSER